VEADYVALPAVASRSAALTPAARVIAAGVNAARLELASELGATDTVNPADGDPVSALLELTAGLGAQSAVATSGRLAVLDQAISSLASAWPGHSPGRHQPGRQQPPTVHSTAHRMRFK
jgi:Zn-dependent alcohol dehydrogenase